MDKKPARSAPARREFDRAPTHQNTPPVRLRETHIGDGLQLDAIQSQGILKPLAMLGVFHH
jgi:hypothetical protein